MDKFNTNLVEVINLRKLFKVPQGYLHAVDDVSFTIRHGETLGLVGESGCGKTTVGRSIIRLLEATSGKVLFEERDVLTLNRKELKDVRSKMQIIFQDPYESLNPRVTVSQAITEPLLIQKKYLKNEKEEIKNNVLKMMDLVGLSRRWVNSYPHELDGGRRQRIGIARALVLEPKFIVCDEPVSALDVSIQAQILNLMQDLQAEFQLTYLFITHNLSVVKHLSDHIAVMYLGQLVEKAPTKELFTKPLHPYTKALLSAIPVPDPDYITKRIILKGELSSPINPKVGCRFSKRCMYAYEKCFNVDPVLCEIDMNHFCACHLMHDIERRNEFESINK